MTAETFDNANRKGYGLGTPKIVTATSAGGGIDSFRTGPHTLDNRQSVKDDAEELALERALEDRAEDAHLDEWDGYGTD